MVVGNLLLRCVECGVESPGLAPGWRAYLVDEPDEDEQEQEVLMFCPECAEREFGSFGSSGAQWTASTRRASCVP